MINKHLLYLLPVLAIISGCTLDPATEARLEYALEETSRNSTNFPASSNTRVIQMQACKLAALNKPKLQDLPMAAISVRPGNKINDVRFSVRWEGTKGHGICKVSNDGYVEHVNIQELHTFQKRHHQSSTGAPKDIDGFYYDRHSEQWRDPDGEVCHSCTPENGFPIRQHGW